MALSHNDTLHKQQSASTTHGGRQQSVNNQNSWVKLVSRRGRNTTSFRKTFVQASPPSSVRNEQGQKSSTSPTNEANTIATSSTSLVDSFEVVRPYIKGSEEDSILIDITEVKNWDLLVDSFNKFGHDSYIGRVGRVHKYLQRSYMETIWARHSEGESKILEGYFLDDGTYVKGYRSFHHEAEIVRVKLEKLPFLVEPELKLEMEVVLRDYGQILDLGIFRTSAGCYMGHGYAHS